MNKNNDNIYLKMFSVGFFDKNWKKHSDFLSDFIKDKKIDFDYNFIYKTLLDKERFNFIKKYIKDINEYNNEYGNVVLNVLFDFLFNMKKETKNYKKTKESLKILFENNIDLLYLKSFSENAFEKDEVIKQIISNGENEFIKELINIKNIKNNVFLKLTKEEIGQCCFNSLYRKGVLQTFEMLDSFIENKIYDFDLSEKETFLNKVPNLMMMKKINISILDKLNEKYNINGNIINNNITNKLTKHYDETLDNELNKLKSELNKTYPNKDEIKIYINQVMIEVYAINKTYDVLLKNNYINNINDFKNILTKINEVKNIFKENNIIYKEDFNLIIDNLIYKISIPINNKNIKINI